MSKALRAISNYVKSIDLIVEVVDARAPLSSRNPLLDELAGNKARLLLLAKADMADRKVTDAWLAYFSSLGIPAVAGNLKKDRFLAIVGKESAPLVAGKRAKEKKYGMKPQPIRVMVIGIPNVGKSTLINNIGGRKIANTGNKAGITRAEQWIKLNDDFTVLDTPGILPMNYPDAAQAVRLALLGTMREEVLPTEDLAAALLGYLKENYPHALKDRFAIDDIAKADSLFLLEAIAIKRGLLDGPNPSKEKAAYLLIKEFKDGILGDFSLEMPHA